MSYLPSVSCGSVSGATRRIIERPELHPCFSQMKQISSALLFDLCHISFDLWLKMGSLWLFIYSSFLQVKKRNEPPKIKELHEYYPMSPWCLFLKPLVSNYFSLNQNEFSNQMDLEKYIKNNRLTNFHWRSKYHWVGISGQQDFKDGIHSDFKWKRRWLKVVTVQHTGSIEARTHNCLLQ